MTRKKNIITSLGFLLILIAIIAFIFVRNKERGSTVTKSALETPFRGVIKNTKKIKGAIIPSHVVEIKPQVSGIIEKIYVKVGDKIRYNQPIAKIKVIPSPDEIEDAQKNLETNQIHYELDKKLYDKNLALLEKGGVPQSKLDEVKAKMRISRLNYEASIRKLEMLLESNVRGEGNEDFTVVRSALKGTVLEIPLQEGSSVSKRTSVNDGTSIASVANMNSHIFESKINETDITKIHVGMKLQLSISSLDSFEVAATISEISPLLKNENGINKFSFKASVAQSEYNLPYSGITATADIFLNKTDSVLCIKEKFLQFENEKPYVEIWRNEETVKCDIVTGLSDGVNIEISTGLQLDDKLVVPNWNEK